MAARFALVLLLCQSLVPAGTMPAALGSGWLLQLCPDGVAPAVMAVLHHGHGTHGGHTQHSGGPAGPAGPAMDHGDAWAERCDFAVYAADLQIGQAGERYDPATADVPAASGRSVSAARAPRPVVHPPRAPPAARRA